MNNKLNNKYSYLSIKFKNILNEIGFNNRELAEKLNESPANIGKFIERISLGTVTIKTLDEKLNKMGYKLEINIKKID